MAESALPTLLSLASHELRGPTGVVRGYLRLVEQDATRGERPRCVMVEMTRATERLAALLDELTELAHLIWTARRGPDPGIPPICADRGRTTILALRFTSRLGESRLSSPAVLFQAPSYAVPTGRTTHQARRCTRLT